MGVFNQLGHGLVAHILFKCGLDRKFNNGKSKMLGKNDLRRNLRGEGLTGQRNEEKKNAQFPLRGTLLRMRSGALHFRLRYIPPVPPTEKRANSSQVFRGAQCRRTFVYTAIEAYALPKLMPTTAGMLDGVASVGWTALPFGAGLGAIYREYNRRRGERKKICRETKTNSPNK